MSKMISSNVSQNHYFWFPTKFECWTWLFLIFEPNDYSGSAVDNVEKVRNFEFLLLFFLIMMTPKTEFAWGCHYSHARKTRLGILIMMPQQRFGAIFALRAISLLQNIPPIISTKQHFGCEVIFVASISSFALRLTNKPCCNHLFQINSFLVELLLIIIIHQNQKLQFQRMLKNKASNDEINCCQDSKMGWDIFDFSEQTEENILFQWDGEASFLFCFILFCSYKLYSADFSCKIQFIWTNMKENNAEASSLH